MSADFSRAVSAATKLLLCQRRYSPKIDVMSLTYDKNIIFDSFTNFCRNSRATLSELESYDNMSDGCAIRRGNGEDAIYVVLYNDKVKSVGRRSFTLAHEIGHIYLGHECDNPDEEAEANHFAAQLLLPSVLVWELLKRRGCEIPADELAQIFGTSKQAANNRLENLSKIKNPQFSADECRLLKKLDGLLPRFDGPIIDC